MVSVPDSCVGTPAVSKLLGHQGPVLHTAGEGGILQRFLTCVIFLSCSLWTASWSVNNLPSVFASLAPPPWLSAYPKCFSEGVGFILLTD